MDDNKVIDINIAKLKKKNLNKNFIDSKIITNPIYTAITAFKKQKKQSGFTFKDLFR